MDLTLNTLCQFAMLVTTKLDLPVDCVPETELKLQRVTLPASNADIACDGGSQVPNDGHTACGL